MPRPTKPAVPNTRKLPLLNAVAPVLESLERRRLFAFQVGINFGPYASEAESGYVTDNGDTYGVKQSGLTYGWNANLTSRPFDHAAGRTRKWETGINTAGTGLAWEIAVPNGTYSVRLVAGDANVTSGTYNYNVEGTSGFLSGAAATGTGAWVTGTGTVTVSDGKLTVANGTGSVSNLAFIDITDLTAKNRATVGTPGNLVARARLSTNVDLTWTDNADNDDFEGGYLIERKTGSGSYSQIAAAGGGLRQLYSDYTTAAGTTYTYRIRAKRTNTSGTSVNSAYSNEVTITTPANDNQGPYLGTAFTLPATIEAEDYDRGAAGSAYNDSTGANAGGFYRAGSVDVGMKLGTGAETGTNAYYVGWIDSTDWQEYTVDVPAAGTYYVDASVSSAGTGGAWKVQVGGVDKASATVADTGGFHQFATQSTAAFALSAGTGQVFRFQATAKDATGKFVGNFDSFAVRRFDAPTAVAATAASAAQVNLSWASLATNPTGFVIKRKTGAGGTYATVAAVGASATAWQDTTVSGGTQYFYKVCATRDLNGTSVSSADSAEVSATTSSSATAPAAASALTTAASAGRITLAWTDNSTNETGFVVQRRQGAGAWATLLTTGANVTGYVDTTVTAGQAYSYQVVATNAAGNAAASNAAAATAPSSIALSPTGDSYTQSGTNADTNFGTATELDIKNSPTAGFDRQGYLKFDLTGVGNVGSVKLQVYGRRNNTQDGSSIDFSVYSVADTSWIETGLTYNNRPAKGGVVGGFTSVAPNGSNTLYEIDVTSYVQAEIAAGRPVISLAVAAVQSNTSAYLIIPSKESSTSKPQLLVGLAANTAPTVATAASASPTPVTGTTTTLSALGADDGGEAGLTYTWTTTSKPAGAADPTFNVNGTNAAKSAVATFIAVGAYTFLATISDGTSTVTSSVNVTVSPTLTSIGLSPSAVTMGVGATQQFTPTGRDQFGQTLAAQPSFTWSVPTGGGTVTTAGLYTAPAASGSAVVRASAGGLNGNGTITVSNNAPTVATAASASPSPVTGTTTTLSVLGADDGGEAGLTYTWATTSKPTGAADPTFSVNGSNVAKSAVATFTQSGTYSFTVTISDGTATTTSSVSVPVTMSAVAPTAPTSVAAVALSPKTLRITWNDIATTESGYRVQYRVQSSTGTYTIVNLGAGSTTADITNLSAGTAYEVQVTALGGTNSAAAAAIGSTYTAPVITASSPKQEGTAVTLGVNLGTPTPAFTPTYAWTLTGGTLSGATGGAPTFTPTDDGTYTAGVTVTYANGDTAILTSATAVVNVAPTLTLSGSSTVTTGQTYALTVAHADPGTDTITSWAVNWGDGSTVQTFTGSTPAPTHLYATAGTYTIGATATDEDGTFAATALNLTVTATPVTPAAPTAVTATALSPKTIRVSWNDVATNETGYQVQYRLQGSTGAYTSVSLPAGSTTADVTNLTAGTAYAFQVTALGTTNSTAVATNGITLAGPTISSSAPKQEGTAITLGVNLGTPAPATAPTYAWTISNGTLSGSTTANPTFTPADDGAYTAGVTVTYANGDAVAATSAFSVVNIAPAVVAAGPSAGDVGSVLTFTSVVTDPSSADTTAGFAYAWTVTKDGAAFTPGSSSTNPTFTFTPVSAGAYVVTLVATDKNGASGNSSVTTDVTAPFALVLPTPQSAVGQPISLQLHNHQPQTKAVASWQVNWGDGTPVQTVTGGPTTSTPNDAQWDVTHTYATAGTFTIHATAIDSASGIHDAGSATETIRLPISLAAPTDLQTSNITSGSLTLSWKAAVGSESGFHVYYSKNGSGFHLLEDVAASRDDAVPVDVTLTGLQASASYAFKVTAYAGTVESDVSQVTIAQTLSLTNRQLAINGPASTTVGTAVRWTVDEGQAAEPTDATTYVWAVLLGGHSVASGQGNSLGFLPATAADYVVQLTAIGPNAAPQVVTQILHVQPPSIAPCTVLGPPVSEIDRTSIFSIDSRGLDFGPFDGDPPPQPRFDWTLRDAQGHVVETQSGGWDHSTAGFKLSTLGEMTISVLITRTDGKVGYEGSTTTTSTVGAPDDFNKAFVDFGSAGEMPDQVIQDHNGNFVVVGLDRIGNTGYVSRAGAFLGEGNHHGLKLTRLKADLTLDNSWGVGGRVTLASQFEGQTFLGRQIVRELDNGELLVAALDNGNERLNLVKLTSTGTLDISFGDGGIVRWAETPSDPLPSHFRHLEDMVVAADGSIMVSGETSSDPFQGVMEVMRFNGDGTLDDGSVRDSDPSTHFGQRGIAVNSIHDGLPPLNLPYPILDRILDRAMSLLIGPDGSIYVGGQSFKTHVRDADPRADGDLTFSILKLHHDGTRDLSFGESGNGYAAINLNPQRFDFANTLIQDSQGRLVLVGTSYDYTTELGDAGGPSDGFAPFYRPSGPNVGSLPLSRIAVARFTPNGAPDLTFGPDHSGHVLSNFYGNETAWASTITSDDKIVVAGVAPDGGLISRFDVNGSPDSSFGNDGKIILDTGFDARWQSVIIASDNDIVVAGDALRLASDGVTTEDGFGIAKYRPNDVAARDLTATATTNGTIVLNWADSGTTEDGFEILRSTSPSGPGSGDVVGLAMADAATWTDATAVPGQRYYYKVVAFDTLPNGNRRPGGATNVASAQTAPKNSSYVLQETIAVPVTGSIVESLNALTAGQNYRITARGFFAIDQNPDPGLRKKADAQWGLYNPVPSRYGIVGKHVQYGIGINDQTLDLNRFPDWGDPSTDSAHTYSIDYSPDSTATVKLNFHDNYYPDNQPGYAMLVDIYRSLPSAPEQVNATVDRARRRIGVTWTNTAVDADRIVLQRSINGGAFATIATLGRRAESFTDTQVEFNTTYAYRLIARNGFGDSGVSNEAVAVMTNLPPQVDFVDPVTIRIGSPVILQINATDPDVPGSTLGYSLSGAPAGTSIDSDGKISGLTVHPEDLPVDRYDTSKPYYLGQTLVWKVTVTDEAGGTAERFVALTIAPAQNTIPTVATAPHVVSQTDSSALVSVLGSDDGPESGLTYTWITKKRPFGVPLPTFADNATNTAKNTTITFHAAGQYTFEVRVNDGSDYYGSAELPVTVDAVLAGAEVVDPVVRLGAGETHAFQARALDQFGNAWSAANAAQPAFAWSISSGTPHGQINAASGVYTAPPLVIDGQFDTVQVTASIGTSSKTAVGSITLAGADNLPPEIYQNGDEPKIDAQPLSFSTLRLNVFAHDPDGTAGDLTYFWETVNPPEGIVPVVFSDNGTNAAAETVATCSTAAALNYTFRVTVTDKRGGTTWAEIALTDTREFKTVDLTPKDSMLGVGKTATFHATAKDQYDRQLLTQPLFEWRVDGVVVPGQTAPDFAYTAPADEGQHVVTATAVSDGVSHASSARVSVIGQRPPVLKITSPSPSADAGAAVLIDGPTPVDLVVDDLNDDPVTWFLWLKPKSGDRLLVAQGANEIGSAPAQGGPAATLNPTAIPEGTYTLQLTATDDPSAVVEDQRQVRVHSDYKIGSLRLPFVDATITPPAGDPLTATRVYDSMNAGINGDFGYGWSLQTNVTPDAFQTTAHTGDYDDHGTPAFRSGDLVYLTTPDGQQHAFAFVPKKNLNGNGSVLAASYSPRFVAVDGSRGELGVASSGTIVGVPGLPIELRSDPQTGEWFYSTGTGNLGPAAGYNPGKPAFSTTGNEAYKLKTDDGTVYDYNRDGVLQKSTDPNGNTFTYAGNASAGGRQFAVRRDSSNRITGLSDVPGFTFPGTGTPDPTQYTAYTYDAAGDLYTVRDRAQNVTTFTYETVDGVPTHRLTGITDARGVHVATADYDPDTHLLAGLADSTGKGSTVATVPTGEGRTAQATKDAAGVKTESVYDDHGDVVREIRQIRDNAGAVTGYQVTVHDYGYGADNASAWKQASDFGVTNLNKLYDTKDYAPFTIAGADTAGLRYTQIPPTLLNHTEFYYVDPTDYDPARHLASLFQPHYQSTRGADGVMRTTTYLKYAGPGKPEIIKDAHGRLTWLKYDTKGNLTDTINALGEGTETEYDSAGRVIATYRATGTGGSETALPTVTRGQPLGGTSYYAATDAETDKSVGKVKATVDAAGVTTRYTYYPDGSAKAVFREWTDAHGSHSVRDGLSEYDPAGRPVKVTDAHGKTTETHYDAAGQVAYTTDRFGGKTAMVYDTRGQVIRTVYPDGTETRTAYDALGRAAFTTDRFYTGASVAADGVPSAASNTATSLVTRTLYDSLGQITGTERYKNLTITVAADGTLLKAVAPDAAVLPGKRLSATGTAYDDQGRVKETKDATSLVTQTEYYDNGQTKRTRTVASGVASPWTAYDYDRTDALPAGAVSYDSVTDANGHTTKTYKDVIGRTVKTVYADASFADMEYGVFGSVTKTYDQRKTSDPAVYTERQYDLAGRLTDVYPPAVTDADPSSPTFSQSVRPHWQYAYDANGDETGQLDPKGRLTTFGYDDLGQRTRRTLPPDGDGNTANDTETWTYDAYGRTATHVDFKGQATAYAYDPAAEHGGRLLEEQRFTGPATGTPAEKTAYGYDDLGRPNEVKEYAGSTLTRTTTTAYDPATGGVAKVTSPEGVIEHHYNEATGRLDRTWTDNNDTTYRYDGQGRLSKVLVSKLNGQSLATPLTTTYTYDAVGNLLTTTQDEGTATTADDLVTTDTYDTLNRLDTLAAKAKGVAVFDQDYGYTSDSQKHDVLEHRYTATGALAGTTRTTWAYDDDGRLTSERRDEGDDGVQNGGDYTDTFAFDLGGNRTAKTHDAVGTAGDVVTASTYNDRDELTSTSTNGGPPQAATYDPNGNTISDGTTTYTWDLRNRMLSVTVNGVTTTYAYNDTGVRVSKTTNGTKTTFLNDALNPTGYSKPIEERTNGTLSRTYMIGITVLGQADATGSITDILRDGRDYARSLVASGVVIQNVDYGGYGDPLNGVTPSTAAASPDGYRDVETGSYYQNARFRLDGHWLSRDDITLSPGSIADANLFSVVSGNPISNIDPSGHNETLAGTLVTIGTIGALANILLYPNIANAPAPHDRVYRDTGGDMAVGAILSVPLTPAFLYIGKFIISPAIRWGANTVQQFVGKAATRATISRTTPLFRVISEEEWQHIQQTRKLLPEPNGNSFDAGKWFWRSPESAQKWIARNSTMYQNGYRVIQAEIPDEAISASFQRTNLDQIGDAVFVTSERLATIVARETTR